MSVPHGFLRFVDRILAIQLVAVITGTALAFGGAVWWMKPALAVMTVGLATTALIRSALIGRLFVLKSPLTAIRRTLLSALCGTMPTTVSLSITCFNFSSCIIEASRCARPCSL